MSESNSELEAFRQKWREEVTARAHGSTKAPSQSTSKGSRQPPQIPIPPINRSQKSRDNEEEEEPQTNLGGSGRRLSDDEVDESSGIRDAEPQSALEHYEKAVERENQGSLGDSLNLYRKAFRMDDAVDKKYKNKHFPPSSFAPKPANTNPSNASATVPNTAHHSLDGHPQTLKQLLTGYSGASIQPAPPAIEGTPAPPCPISNMPDEILVHIFTYVAIDNVAALVRLAQVCKKMAYLSLTEEQIWKRICLGDEAGFGAMHYRWQREVLGGPLETETPELQSESELPGLQDLTINNVTVDVNLAPTELPLVPLSREAITESLLITAYRSSWQYMFRNRPRIRFNGCYISTVNYIRPGQASTSQLTWQSPVHIVTYYRYLRFFRDGTVISLLTTEEPADVVHNLTKELQETHRGVVIQHLPTSFMHQALKGRWRLSNSDDDPEADMKDAEGDVFIETEGATKKYMYRMQLSVRSAGKGSRNNKLVWQGFWNYNILTDDTGVFTLRNDKAFFFSRVKSYGSGA